MKKPKKKLKPIEARTFKELCSLPTDNVNAKGFWMMVDEGVVTITKQNLGEAPTSQIDVPRAQFDRMVRWYVTGRAGK